MADCDICGAPADTKASVEGAVINVCRKCVSYGKEIVPKPVPRSYGLPGPSGRLGAAGLGTGSAAGAQARPAGPKDIYVVENAGKLVQKAREREKLSVYDLAREIFVNADYLKQIEAGKRVPDEKTAKKIGARLRMTLVSDKQAEE